MDKQQLGIQHAKRFRIVISLPQPHQQERTVNTLSDADSFIKENLLNIIDFDEWRNSNRRTFELINGYSLTEPIIKSVTYKPITSILECLILAYPEYD